MTVTIKIAMHMTVPAAARPKWRLAFSFSLNSMTASAIPPKLSNTERIRRNGIVLSDNAKLPTTNDKSPKLIRSLGSSAATTLPAGFGGLFAGGRVVLGGIICGRADDEKT